MVPQLGNVYDGVFLRFLVTILLFMHSGYRLVSVLESLPCSYEKLTYMCRHCVPSAFDSTFVHVCACHLCSVSPEHSQLSDTLSTLRCVTHVHIYLSPSRHAILSFVILLFYYSYVDTTLGSFLPPATIPSFTTHSATSLFSPPPQYPAETILPLSLILLKREYK
jgi:hypothetical protein